MSWREGARPSGMETNPDEESKVETENVRFMKMERDDNVHPNLRTSSSREREDVIGKSQRVNGNQGVKSKTSAEKCETVTERYSQALGKESFHNKTQQVFGDKVSTGSHVFMTKKNYENNQWELNRDVFGARNQFANRPHWVGTNFRNANKTNELLTHKSFQASNNNQIPPKTGVSKVKIESEPTRNQQANDSANVRPVNSNTSWSKNQQSDSAEALNQAPDSKTNKLSSKLALASPYVSHPPPTTPSSNQPTLTRALNNLDSSTNAEAGKTCVKCKKVVGIDEMVHFKEGVYHPACFVCDAGCGKSLAGPDGFLDQPEGKFCKACYALKLAPKCHKCKGGIMEKQIKFDGNIWHPECFKCTDCQSNLEGLEITSVKGMPMCKDCFFKKHSDRCKSCGAAITPGNPYMEIDDGKIHSTCFKCAKCGKNLAGVPCVKEGPNFICTSCT